MPNFPSIYLELQELWKSLRSTQNQIGGLDDLDDTIDTIESAIDALQDKTQCISHSNDPTNSTVIGCDLRVSGSGNPQVYIGPTATNSNIVAGAAEKELLVIGGDAVTNDVYMSVHNNDSRVVMGSTSTYSFIGTQTDTDLRIRKNNTTRIIISGDNSSGTTQITGKAKVTNLPIQTDSSNRSVVINDSVGNLETMAFADVVAAGGGGGSGGESVSITNGTFTVEYADDSRFLITEDDSTEIGQLFHNTELVFGNSIQAIGTWTKIAHSSNPLLCTYHAHLRIRSDLITGPSNLTTKPFYTRFRIYDPGPNGDLTATLTGQNSGVPHGQAIRLKIDGLPVPNKTANLGIYPTAFTAIGYNIYNVIETGHIDDNVYHYEYLDGSPPRNMFNNPDYGLPFSPTGTGLSIRQETPILLNGFASIQKTSPDPPVQNDEYYYIKYNNAQNVQPFMMLTIFADTQRYIYNSSADESNYINRSVPIFNILDISFNFQVQQMLNWGFYTQSPLVSV